MKSSFKPLLAIMLITGTFFSCTKSDSLDSNISLSNQELLKMGDKLKTKYRSGTLPLSGSQEVQPTGSLATGEFTVVYNTKTKILQLNMTWQGLTNLPTASHIHGPAPAGVNAGVVIPLFSFTGEDLGTFSADLLTTNFANFVEADLLNGMYYINIHTSTYPGGEIRGQILFE